MSFAPKHSDDPLPAGQSSDPLVKDALAHIVRLHSGDETEADRISFESWKARSDRHAAAAGRAEALWQGLQPALQRYRGAGRRMTSLILLVSVGMALAAMAIVRPPSYAALFADYRTATGEVRDRKSVV